MATIIIAGRTLDVRQARSLTVGEMKRRVFPWRAKLRAAREQPDLGPEFEAQSIDLALEGLLIYLDGNAAAAAALDEVPAAELWDLFGKVYALTSEVQPTGEAPRP